MLQDTSDGSQISHESKHQCLLAITSAKTIRWIRLGKLSNNDSTKTKFVEACKHVNQNEDIDSTGAGRLQEYLCYCVHIEEKVFQVILEEICQLFLMMTLQSRFLNLARWRWRAPSSRCVPGGKSSICKRERERERKNTTFFPFLLNRFH